MSFFRSVSRRASPLTRSLPHTTYRSSISPALTRGYAHSGYGDGEGDPKGEKPQSQGSNPSADLEHPGPPPPSEGHGSGAGPTKGSSDGHSSSSGKQEKGTTSSSSGGDGGSPSNKAQPKIHDERSGPKAGPEADRDDVQKHNQELEGRHDRAYNQLNQDNTNKVDKNYWKGTGGADKDP
ncbi:MAG: hypothetical protein M4579_005827 [Chaenotheca gracillima]|nr:MAG: hypothetical protein M4579_005827 [Chaenotheca gracillima]